MTGTHNAKSAGAIGDEGTEISSRCLEVMKEVGMDLSNERSHLLTESMVDSVEKVILFPTDFMPDYAKNSPKAETWDVADPHYNKDKGMAFVREVRDDIKRRVEELIKKGEDA
jgi:protein-tyrosine-phosphatase